MLNSIAAFCRNIQMKLNYPVPRPNILSGGIVTPASSRSKASAKRLCNFHFSLESTTNRRVNRLPNSFKLSKLNPSALLAPTWLIPQSPWSDIFNYCGNEEKDKQLHLFRCNYIYLWASELQSIWNTWVKSAKESPYNWIYERQSSYAIISGPSIEKFWLVSPYDTLSISGHCFVAYKK